MRFGFGIHPGLGIVLSSEEAHLDRDQVRLGQARYRFRFRFL